MEKYWEGVKNTEEIDRGLYIILPLRYQGDFQKIPFSAKKTNTDQNNKSDEERDRSGFDSDDFLEILSIKCRSGEFVKRCMLEEKVATVKRKWKEAVKIPFPYDLTQLQVFSFNNGIAFLTVYLAYKNKDVQEIYQLINPGYIDDKKQEIQDSLLAILEQEVFESWHKEYGVQLKWFGQSEKTKIYMMKEAYQLNVAALPKRFEERKIAEKIAYNEHRLIDVTKEFSDLSEKDVEYASGARDVNDSHYGWACAITSQEIAYAYGPKPGKTVPLTAEALLERAEDDLALTMIVMYQKYTCMLLNEKIHERFQGISAQSIRGLKKEALEFIAYGTLTPSQVSKWNNVCETYRALQKENGVNEALDEIKEKIELLNEEQDHIDSKRESRVSMIIAVFGFVSIVAAALQILDYLSSGKGVMIGGFVGAVSGILTITLYYFKKIENKSKNNEII